MNLFSRRPLTEVQLRETVPSVFATQAAADRSARYGFASTWELIQAFAATGWRPVDAFQTWNWDADRRDYARHVVRFGYDWSRLSLDDCLVELVLVNSHDGSTAYQLYAGLFRIVCSNGLICPLGDLIETIRARHDRGPIDEALRRSRQLVEAVPRLTEVVHRLQDRGLSPVEQQSFAAAALALRYGDDWAEAAPVGPEQLLAPRRAEDLGDDLWTVFNRVQENLLRGGLRGRAQDGRIFFTRRIRAVTPTLRLNRGLWQLAMHWAGPESPALPAAWRHAA